MADTTLYLHYDPNNGNEAIIFYAKADHDFADKHSTNIPLTVKEWLPASVVLDIDYRKHMAIGGPTDINHLHKYYFDIALDIIVERAGWVEHDWNEIDD